MSVSDLYTPRGLVYGKGFCAVRLTIKYLVGSSVSPPRQALLVQK